MVKIYRWAAPVAWGGASSFINTGQLKGRKQWTGQDFSASGTVFKQFWRATVWRLRSAWNRLALKVTLLFKHLWISHYLRDQSQLENSANTGQRKDIQNLYGATTHNWILFDGVFLVIRLQANVIRDCDNIFIISYMCQKAPLKCRCSAEGQRPNMLAKKEDEKQSLVL